MAIFDWTKEIKEEIKNAVTASVETAKEVARLQERILRAENDYKETTSRFESLLTAQHEQIAVLRDRVATLEAQQTALHNDAMVIAARHAATNESARRLTAEREDA